MYELLKSIHIMSFTSWMAGLFYLPRIFVYHAERGGEVAHTSDTFKIMERKLYKYIMTPAMLSTWITGIFLIHINGYFDSFEFWLLVKVFLVVMLTLFHARCGRWVEAFRKDTNRRSGRYYRFANEVPTVVFVGVVLLVVLRPA